jgi:YHS domain-containing protein
MTAQRQEANGMTTKARFWPGIPLISLVLLPGLWPAGEGGLAGWGSAARAATTERIVTNRYSGVAIEGFDPVAYFIDGRPRTGLPEFEAAQAGVVWRFCNEGNRASFVAHPEIYGPQFGGYDPVDVARGVTVGGNPLIWAVSGQRLYLFSREENRDTFAANPLPYLKEAAARWPALEEKLAQ